MRFCIKCGGKTRVCGIGMAPAVLDDNEYECLDCGYRCDSGQLVSVEDCVGAALALCSEPKLGMSEADAKRVMRDLFGSESGWETLTPPKPGSMDGQPLWGAEEHVRRSWRNKR